MEVQQEVLEQLKCSNCTGYLLSAPVLLTTGGQSVCGQCPAPEKEPATRNQPYELLAQHVVFPCKYQEEGCPQRFAFGQLQAHEEGCEYRKYVCPVAATGACEWLGPRGELVGHCRAEHPDSIIENPHVFRHNITTSSVHAYVMTVFNVLFLVHTKVCKTTRKIYHSVRYLGHPEHAACFKFTIDIDKNDSTLIRRGQVAPQGCLYIQEDIAVQVGINSLLDILGGYEGATFKLTMNQVSQLPKPAEVLMCAMCGACVASPAYQDKDGWYCDVCTPRRRKCRDSSRGCTHTEIDGKAWKHEHFYCEHRSAKCWTCSEVPAGSQTAHCISRHPEHVRQAGTAWRHTSTDNKEYRYVVSEVGVLACWGSLKPSAFILYVWSPLPRVELCLYECVVVLEHPTTGHTRQFTPTPLYDTQWDWMLHLKADDVPLFCHNVETSVTIDLVKKL